MRTTRYLIASDFDQTLSFNDSGLVLSELIGVSGFQRKVAGLSGIHLPRSRPRRAPSQQL